MVNEYYDRTGTPGTLLSQEAEGTLLTELNCYDIEVEIPESETLWARFWGQA